jgi:hypothetical protein
MEIWSSAGFEASIILSPPRQLDALLQACLSGLTGRMRAIPILGLLGLLLFGIGLSRKIVAGNGGVSRVRVGVVLGHQIQLVLRIGQSALRDGPQGTDHGMSEIIPLIGGHDVLSQW